MSKPDLTKKEKIAAQVAAGIFASGQVSDNHGAPDFWQIASDSVTMAEEILDETERRRSLSDADEG